MPFRVKYFMAPARFKDDRPFSTLNYLHKRYAEMKPFNISWFVVLNHLLITFIPLPSL